MLIIITAEGFTPINLGFGFTLNGVGGLLAVNRTVAVEPLRQGLKQRTLDAVLFPKDPVRNAPQIISNLRQLFPVKRDQFAFGPMAIIGWGTPTVLTIELALVLEFPSPFRLIALGQFRALLPSKDKPLVRLNMDALGVVDFDRGELAIDATLYDSRILHFNVSGDMALRVRWTDDPAFLLAVGGFHPRFQPPPGFPTLERIAVSLTKGNNPRLRLTAYLALTSNTAQIGAHLDLFVAAGGASVEGLSELRRALSVCAVPIHRRSGRRRHPQVARPHAPRRLPGDDPVGTGAVARPRQSQDQGLASSPCPSASIRRSAMPHPPRSRRSTPCRNSSRPWAIGATGAPSCRRPAPCWSRCGNSRPPTRCWCTPSAGLSVRQRVLPLNVEISRFGNTTPSGDRRFTITQVAIHETPVEERAADQGLLRPRPVCRDGRRPEAHEPVRLRGWSRAWSSGWRRWPSAGKRTLT